MTNPEARRWRDAAPEQFAAAILAAAEQLGVLPLAVEKDYWVCEALRAITLSHPGEVIFKGGTSLEKLRIIRRFSEDLDLLVVGGHPSDNATKNALKAMLNSAATASLGEPSDVKSGGKQGSYWRRGYLVPPLVHSNTTTTVAIAPWNTVSTRGHCSRAGRCRQTWRCSGSAMTAIRFTTVAGSHPNHRVVSGDSGAHCPRQLPVRRIARSFSVTYEK